MTDQLPAGPVGLAELASVLPPPTATQSEVLGQEMSKSGDCPTDGS